MFALEVKKYFRESFLLHDTYPFIIMLEIRHICTLHSRFLSAWKLYLDANYYETLEISKYSYEGGGTRLKEIVLPWIFSPKTKDQKPLSVECRNTFAPHLASSSSIPFAHLIKSTYKFLFKWHKQEAK